MASLIKTLFYSLSFYFFLIAPLCGQSTIPHIQWAKSFGGTDIDQAFSIEETTDHGFIIAGASYSEDLDIAGHHGSTDNPDYWIVKLDSNGNLEWQRSLGGTGDDVANCIKQTRNGGYIVAGYSNSNDGDVSGNRGGYDYWIVELDENGKIVWQKSYGGSRNDIANSVELHSDGGYIIAGTSFSNDKDVTGHYGSIDSADCWIIKVDTTGNLQWGYSFGGTDDNAANEIRRTSDNGYVIDAYSTLDKDFSAIRIDSVGSNKWEVFFGGSGDDRSFSVDPTRDNGYVFAGFSNSVDAPVTNNHGSADFWIVKLDSTVNIIWQKSLGGTSEDAAYSVRQTIDGGFIAAGSSASTNDDVTGNHGGNDYWIVKLDSMGNLQWQKTLGGPGEDFALCVRQTSDSGYIIAGSSDFDGGDVSGNHNHEDFWIVKLGTQEKTGVVFSDRDKFKTGSNYPNPFSARTTISFSTIANTGSSLHLYNQLGQQIRTMNIQEGSKNVLLDRSGLPSGMYVYHVIRNGEIVERGRIVAE